MAAPHDSTRLVSVVVPVWDRYVERFFQEALATLLEQSCLAEVIVVDNASSTPVAVDDERVVVVRSPTRLTCGAARNFGLRHARAPLVVMWDADDLMLPGTLDYLSGALSADDELVAHAAAILETPDRRHRWPRRMVSTLTGWPRLFAFLNCVWSQYPTTGATVMRTDVVLDAGGYLDAEAAEDWSLGVALLWRGKVAWSERPGRIYRRHGASTWSRNSTARHLLLHARAVRDLLRRDPAVPAWCRRVLPLIKLGQYAAVVVVRPVTEAVRGLAAGPSISTIEPGASAAPVPAPR